MLGKNTKTKKEGWTELYHTLTSKWGLPKNENNTNNEDNSKNVDNRKNELDPENEDDPKIKTT